MQTRKRYFTRFKPHYSFRAQRDVYRAMKYFARGGNECWASTSKLIRQSGWSAGAFFEARCWLLMDGCIEPMKSETQTSRYRLVKAPRLLSAEECRALLAGETAPNTAPNFGAAPLQTLEQRPLRSLETIPTVETLKALPASPSRAASESPTGTRALRALVAPSEPGDQVLVGSAPSPRLTAWLATLPKALLDSPHIVADLSAKFIALGDWTADDALATALRWVDESPRASDEEVRMSAHPGQSFEEVRQMLDAAGRAFRQEIIDNHAAWDADVFRMWVRCYIGIEPDNQPQEDPHGSQAARGPTAADDFGDEVGQVSVLPRRSQGTAVRNQRAGRKMARGAHR
jgi:hypothetical protein